MMECEHPAFEASATINIIEKEHAFMVDLSIRCLKCGTSFVFLGLKHGINLNYPMCSIDGTEARLPIAPMEELNDKVF